MDKQEGIWRTAEMMEGQEGQADGRRLKGVNAYR